MREREEYKAVTLGWYNLCWNLKDEKRKALCEDLLRDAPRGRKSKCKNPDFGMNLACLWKKNIIRDTKTRNDCQ